MDQSILNKITHERNLAVAFNYAYEVVGEGLVSDAIYEYGLRNLEALRDNHPEEWANCDTFREFFSNNDWATTGSHSPRCSEAAYQHEVVLARKNNGIAPYDRR